MSLPSPDDWKTILSILAFCLSLVSFWFSRKSWLQTNRPIVTATVETHRGGNEAITYNLVVSNTGNRPATDVHIHAKINDVEACIAEWVKQSIVPDSIYSAVLRCFSDEGKIPLLLNGKSLTNSFGYTSHGNRTFWLYGVNLPIKIEYYDLDGRKYESIQTLKVKDSDGFAGGIWSS